MSAVGEDQLPRREKDAERETRGRTGSLPLIRRHLTLALRVEHLHPREEVRKIRVVPLLAEDLVELALVHQVQAVLLCESVREIRKR